VIALVGPNGSGKTTLLRALAGLELTRGTLHVDDLDVAALPPEGRPVGWVPQRGALFPHLSVRDNIAYAVGGRRGRARADEELERLDIAALADRKPSALSGGQAQRVALARALARRPRLLLLDEPLSALDADARVDVRRLLRQHLSSYDGVTILVTHDPIDAAALANRVIALDGGRIVQDDRTEVVVRRPRTPWLAAMLGTNAYPGSLRSGAIELDGGGHLVVTDAPSDGRALVLFAPHAVALHAQRPATSARNVWPIVVRQLVDVGGRVRVDADGVPPVVAEVTPAAVRELRLREGANVWASVKATEVTVVVD
jgi:molybdate transport system permease protein